MRVLRLTVQYDGTDLGGFQRQARSGLPTVQGLLERALSELLGHPTRVVGAGRTDAGVHALGQVVHLRTHSPIPTERLPGALNRRLPAAVRVVAAEQVGQRFHARRDATSRIYCYHVLNRTHGSAFAERYAWWVPEPLDVAPMERLAGRIAGRRDFAAFGSPLRKGQPTVRTVFAARLDQAAVPGGGRVLRLCVEADGFLYRMVRLLAGALVRVGLGRLPEQAVADALEGLSPGSAGQGQAGHRLAPAAPAAGVCLVHVNYSGRPAGLELCGSVLDTLCGLWLECPRGSDGWPG